MSLQSQADMLREEWRRDFMRWRPAEHWADFAQWSLTDWERVIKMYAR
jgi:hypothetical protein